MATHLKEGKPETLHDLAERAETYLEAHSSDILFGVDPKFSKIRGSLQPKRCHNCGSTSHLKNQCPKPPPSMSPKNPRTPQLTFRPPGPFQKPPSYAAFKPTPPQREPLRCYTCNKIGHISRDCRSKSTAAMEFQDCYEPSSQQDYFQQLEYPQSQNYPHFSESDDMEEPAPEEVAATATYRPPRSSYGTRPPSGPAKTTIPPAPKPRSPPPPESRPPASAYAPTLGTCWQHNVAGCERCIRPPTPTHHCQALVAVCQDCGQQHPVIADACQSHCRDTYMPVADGLLGKQPVRVLRDTGCSTVVVRRSLIPEENLPGQEERCVLIDGTVRRTPVAQVFIDTPHFSGTPTAVCMKNPLYDVIIGNIPGATDPTTSHPASAVQTRSQVKATKGQSPLITPLIDLGQKM